MTHSSNNNKNHTHIHSDKKEEQHQNTVVKPIHLLLVWSYWHWCFQHLFMIGVQKRARKKCMENFCVWNKLVRFFLLVSIRLPIHYWTIIEGKMWAIPLENKWNLEWKQHANLECETNVSSACVGICDCFVCLFFICRHFNLKLGEWEKCGRWWCWNSDNNKLYRIMFVYRFQVAFCYFIPELLL